ncbi:Potassium efflux system kefA aefA; Flags: Precursor [Stenotrophomonas maltophilia SKK35]|nr:Potassium efflux system kefA aefA; Flags: Precursor [Stenotrophomonas maltophilia SKK35]
MSSFLRSIRARGPWLVLLLCSVFLLSAPVLAQDEDPTPKQQLADIDAKLKEVDRKRGDAAAIETLAMLSDDASKARRDAEALEKSLQPQLDRLDEQLAQLGTPAEGATEPPELAAQRRTLNKQRDGLAASVAQAKTSAVRAQQLATDIDQQRAAQRTEELGQKVASPLSPALWSKVAERLPIDIARVAPLAEQGRDAFVAGIRANGWGTPLLGLVAALVMMFPLRLWLRRLGRQFAASDRAPDGRLRRSGLAMWLLLVGTLLPGYAVVVFIASLNAIGAIAPRLQNVADGVQQATFAAAFIAALSACLLVPSRPSWRLLNLDDTAALKLRKYAWGAAALAWLSTVLVAIDRATRTSDVTTVALDGVIALTYLGLIMAMLVTLARLHRRQTAEAEAKLEAQADGQGPSTPVRRSSWLVLARVAGNIAVVAAIVATLLGYVNFAKFVNQQLIGGSIVVLAATLLFKFVDDLSTWMLNADSKVGQTILLSTGLSVSRLEQAGVLLSAMLRSLVVLVALLALAAPFGNVGTIVERIASLSNGIEINKDLTLQPGRIVTGVLVLLVGMGLTQLLQRWLTDTYLPKTELDLGARNSISTIAGYVGIILVGLWALTAMGLNLKNLALLVSALSVGIGFGLQAIIQNFVSGLILLAERPVKIGDWVKLGDQEGDIRRINVRSTEIQVGDRSTLIVPNSELITKTIRNMTMGNNQGRIQIQFAVPPSTDVGNLRQALLDAYTAHTNVLKQPAPTVYIDSIAGGQITMNSFAYVASPRQVYATRSDLYFSLLQILAERNIPLSTPTDIHITRDPQE